MTTFVPLSSLLFWPFDFVSNGGFPDFTLFRSLIAIVDDEVSTEVTVMFVFATPLEFPFEASEALFWLEEGEDDEEEWLWVNTDLMFNRFIQSRKVRAGMLYFMDERLILEKR